MKQVFIIIFILISVLLFSNEQKIISKLINDQYCEIIRPSEYPNSYVGTIVVDDNKLGILYESMGFYPTIMAYKVSNEILEIYIRSRWTGDEHSPRKDEIYSSI